MPTDPTPITPQAEPDPPAPLRFAHPPTVAAPFPFSTREFARLLVLRGRVRDGEIDDHREQSLPRAA